MTKTKKKPKALTPPDLSRCQAEITEGSFMTLGGRRTYRCDGSAVFIVKELQPGDDGKRGSMSMCNKCLHIFQEIHPNWMKRYSFSSITPVAKKRRKP